MCVPHGRCCVSIANDANSEISLSQLTNSWLALGHSTLWAGFVSSSVCVSIPIGQPDPNAIANANPDPPTPADREVPVHGRCLVIVPCGLNLCACRTRAAVCVCGRAGFKNGGFSQQTALLFWFYLCRQALIFFAEKLLGSFIADGLNVAILSVVTMDLPIFPRSTPYDFLSRIQHISYYISQGGHQSPVATICSMHEITQSTMEPKRPYATHPLPQDNK